MCQPIASSSSLVRSWPHLLQGSHNVANGGEVGNLWVHVPRLRVLAGGTGTSSEMENKRSLEVARGSGPAKVAVRAGRCGEAVDQWR
jgi:hypothetical protein